jgi:hypothetical protein
MQRLGQARDLIKKKMNIGCKVFFNRPPRSRSWAIYTHHWRGMAGLLHPASDNGRDHAPGLRDPNGHHYFPGHHGPCSLLRPGVPSIVHLFPHLSPQSPKLLENKIHYFFQNKYFLQQAVVPVSRCESGAANPASLPAIRCSGGRGLISQHWLQEERQGDNPAVKVRYPVPVTCP